MIRKLTVFFTILVTVTCIHKFASMFLNGTVLETFSSFTPISPTAYKYPHNVEGGETNDDSDVVPVIGHSVPLKSITPVLEHGAAGIDSYMFYHNKSSPSCCPSTYSTSTGCVCTSKEQRLLLNTRGMNNTEPEN